MKIRTSACHCSGLVALSDEGEDLFEGGHRDSPKVMHVGSFSRIFSNL
jgi:hypothetical protein